MPPYLTSSGSKARRKTRAINKLLAQLHPASVSPKAPGAAWSAKQGEDLKISMQNMLKRAASRPVLPATATPAKQHIILPERASLRSPQDSMAMNLLRSPGLIADSVDQIHEALQRIHPPKQDHNIDTMSPHLSHPSGTFNY